MPTVPAFRDPSYGFEIFIFVSVMPYLSRIFLPVLFSNSMWVSESKGAEPEINSLMCFADSLFNFSFANNLV